eukprot:scaffold48392_cov31-Tisochrysis_lutea.AAC.1
MNTTLQRVSSARSLRFHPQPPHPNPTPSPPTLGMMATTLLVAMLGIYVRPAMRPTSRSAVTVATALSPKPASGMTPVAASARIKVLYDSSCAVCSARLPMP